MIWVMIQAMTKNDPGTLTTNPRSLRVVSKHRKHSPQSHLGSSRTLLMMLFQISFGHSPGAGIQLCSRSTPTDPTIVERKFVRSFCRSGNISSRNRNEVTVVWKFGKLKWKVEAPKYDLRQRMWDISNPLHPIELPCQIDLKWTYKKVCAEYEGDPSSFVTWAHKMVILLT